MATLIPSRIPRSKTAGEQRLFRILSRLPDDCIVYFEPLIEGSCPDFVVVSPRIGLLVIEDKHWRPGTVAGRSGERVRLRLRDGGIKTVTHPQAQVRAYNQRIRERAADPRNRWGGALLHPDGNYEGCLVFPVGDLVTLSNITRAQLEDPDRGLDLVFDRDRVVTRDELEQWESLEAEDLLEVLKNHFALRWPFVPLSRDQVRAARLLISPQLELKDAFSTDELLRKPRPLDDRLDLLRVLDLRQEDCARSIGEGHRVLFGIAGSGKTVVLLARARMLAERDPAARILMTCFNRPLAEWLSSQFSDCPQIEVRTFHSWGTRRGVRFRRDRNPEEFGRELLAKLEKGADRERVYDAVLVDEAQDFEPDWFRCLLAAMKDPENGDLVIVADGAQGLYRRSRISWSQLGIKARGRTHSRIYDLDRNYRNTREVLALAETFASKTDATRDGIMALPVELSRCVRGSGVSPILFRTATAASEVDAALRWIRDLLAGRWGNRELAPVDPSEIAVLYPGATGEYAGLVDRLPSLIGRELGVPAAVHRSDSIETRREGVSIRTIHSAKGLQFRAVVVIGTGEMPRRFRGKGSADSVEAAEARLLYVAMTRAESFLALTASRSSAFVERLESSPACDVRVISESMPSAASAG